VCRGEEFAYAGAASRPPKRPAAAPAATVVRKVASCNVAVLRSRLPGFASATSEVISPRARGCNDAFMDVVRLSKRATVKWCADSEPDKSLVWE
jgi:hypothetical protein